ncbi:hypothetical protein BD779DRAFT_1445829 [Infundibulicybe gibba]|nr:hypothetical protein BD779DRAFT_1445829 [Infundibulicybe gibba]
MKRAAERPCVQNVKEGGLIKESMRTMSRELVKLGVPVKNVSEAVHSVADGLSIAVTGDISTRSVGRLTLEGGIAAKLQLVHEIENAASLTLSGDGTTHKHINYESRHIALQVPDYRATIPSAEFYPWTDLAVRLVGISSAPNHTSQEQMKGWKDFVDEAYGLWNSSPAGKRKAIDYHNFYLKSLAMGTDHANDQKKLKKLFQDTKRFCDREVRGERALLMLAPTELIHVVCQLTEKKIADAGGQGAWDALQATEQARRNECLHQDLLQEYGERAYNALPPAQQKEVDFFVWGGCCMHKDLNAHKGGNARMMAYWSSNNIVGPTLLMNKDNDAAAALGKSAARTRAEDVSSAGGVKLTSLMGSLFHHRDDKKGQQESTAIFFESQVGYTISFPDTSNTRYQSHSEAAAEVIVHLPVYIRFLDFIRNKKESRAFNHMEANIWKALHDIPTLTELCVLALYGQAITHPYMRQVRGANRQTSNLLELGPLHKKVKAHLRTLIKHPELLYGPEATYSTGSMDGQLWDCPEAVYAVQALAGGLPHIHGTLVAFLEGALETWERFSTEFSEDGEIANTSDIQRHRAWMPTTNDHNEGALGSLRVGKRKAPNMTLETYNARKMYKHNDTRAFVETQLTHPEDHAFLRRLAREIGSDSRSEQADTDAQLVEGKLEKDRVQEQKQSDRAAVISAVQCQLDEDEILKSNLTVKEIELQLEWHRRHEDLGGLVPKKKDLPRKQEKLDALIAAVNRYNTHLSTVSHQPNSSHK